MMSRPIFRHTSPNTKNTNNASSIQITNYILFRTYVYMNGRHVDEKLYDRFASQKIFSDGHPTTLTKESETSIMSSEES